RAKGLSMCDARAGLLGCGTQRPARASHFQQGFLRRLAHSMFRVLAESFQRRGGGTGFATDLAQRQRRLAPHGPIGIAQRSDQPGGGGLSLRAAVDQSPPRRRQVNRVFRAPGQSPVGRLSRAVQTARESRPTTIWSRSSYNTLAPVLSGFFFHFSRAEGPAMRFTRRAFSLVELIVV